MGQTPPQPYRLGNGRIVTPANPALVWADPITMQDHDRSVVQRLLAGGRGRPAPSSREHCGD